MLNDIERDILLCMNFLKKDAKKATLDAISVSNQHEILEIKIALDKLTDSYHIINDSSEFIMTEKGFQVSQEIFNEELEKSFDKALTRVDGSNVYKKYCSEVYGKDMGQFNMVCNKQWMALTESLAQFINEDSSVLDVGCGIGYIAENIQKYFECNVYGSDIAKTAVDNANFRNKNNTKLKFGHFNINEMNITDHKFDAILYIDTLYFSKDIEKTILQSKKLLNSNGKIIIFWTDKLSEDVEIKKLRDYSRETKVGNILQKLNIKFSSIDFTNEDHKHWKRVSNACELLKDEFENEGLSDIYKSKKNESDNVLSKIDTGLMRRYLYIF